MDMDQIRAFATIVREGSFGRAALTLDLAQATMSTRIQALERAVGGPLFLRGGRRIALTERGESFLCYAQRALALLDEGVEASRLAQEGQRGRVTLAVEQTLAEGLLARAIARLHRRHPQVEVAVEAAGCDAVVGKVHDGAARLGLVSWPYPSHAYDALTPLVRLRDPLILAVGPAHPLAAGGRRWRSSAHWPRPSSPSVGITRRTLSRSASSHRPPPRSRYRQRPPTNS